MEIKEIKKMREKDIVVYTRYCQEKKQNPKKLFCFFEGEDGKYYIPRITKYTNYGQEQIICYKCNGKEGVLKLHTLIEKNNDSYSKAFFIDKDYKSINKNSKLIYETPSYAIENFYVSLDAFKRMLNIEFGINYSDNDFKKCVEDYQDRKKEFHEYTILLNAWLSYQINKGKEVNLSEFKISKLFSKISIQEITLKNIIDIEKIEELFPNTIELEEEDLEEERKKFNKEEKLFRGKFEIEFLQKIIDSLIQVNRNGDYFSCKYNSVTINPHINPISSLTGYADTPECLIKFLKQFENIQ